MDRLYEKILPGEGRPQRDQPISEKEIQALRQILEQITYVEELLELIEESEPKVPRSYK